MCSPAQHAFNSIRGSGVFSSRKINLSRMDRYVFTPQKGPCGWSASPSINGQLWSKSTRRSPHDMWRHPINPSVIHGEFEVGKMSPNINVITVDIVTGPPWKFPPQQISSHKKWANQKTAGHVCSSTGHALLPPLYIYQFLSCSRQRRPRPL